MAEESQQGNIQLNQNVASVGLNMDQSMNQMKPGQLSFALNAVVENFDSNSISYQNEPGNELCTILPDGFSVIHTHFITEQNKILFFLVNTETEESEIGYSINKECKYIKLANSFCLNFNINFPIHKSVHRITNCSTEIYWVDGYNDRRYLNIDDIPYKLNNNSNLCDAIQTNELDCNRLKIQPNFKIPSLKVKEVVDFGENKAGVYQFAVQYSDAASNGFTSYYSITNPCPLADTSITTVNFNYNVGKSIVLDISNLDVTGQYEYFNLAVIKTINAITFVELVGTYFINENSKEVTYSGQQADNIRLSINDIFEKFPYYDIANDLTSVQDILIWSDLKAVSKVNYQSIASKIKLMWESYRLPSNNNYQKEENAANVRGYLRDEIYTFELVLLLTNGRQTDRFHIPGREATQEDLENVFVTNPDFIGIPENEINQSSPRWKIYNTATDLGFSKNYSSDNNYTGSYKYGEFGYHESTETYPCNKKVWGELSEQKIRHHRIPDVLISPIYENPVFELTSAFKPVMQDNAIFSLGIKIDNFQIRELIRSSELTQAQKDDIVGYKIVRGNRTTNKSIVAKGILRNIGSYEKEDQTYYYPNYPYNDLSEDAFINKVNNAFLEEASAWLIKFVTGSSKDPSYLIYQYTDVNTGKIVKGTLTSSVGIIEIGSLTRPICLNGVARIGPGNYDMWFASGCFGKTGYRIHWQDPFTQNNESFETKDDYLESKGCVGGAGSCDSVYVFVTQGGQITESSVQGSGNPCPSYVVKEITEAFEQPNAVIVPNTGRRSSLKFDVEKPLADLTLNNKLAYRQIFNSPETSFGQPFLGNVLKLENVMFGAGKAHFVEVKKNAKYRLLSKEAQIDALNSSADVGRITDPFNAGIMFATYQAYLTIYINGITRKNYAYSFNSIANYDYYQDINNTGIKQRELDIARYLIPGVQNVGEKNININNFNRESSVYLRTVEKNEKDVVVSPLPFPNKTEKILGTGFSDYSRFTIEKTGMCSTPGKEQDINVLSYYASIKNIFPSQWGQIYSYESVDTGFQIMLNDSLVQDSIVFGGDTFIGRYSFKTKVPFFIDDKVNAPDDSDIFYDEIGNIGYPKFWHSARSVLKNYQISGYSLLTNIISYKAHNFDCYNDPSTISNQGSASGSYRTYYDGYFYLYAYGQPNFYCESSYNLDLRQAFNNKEGDFWPHVSTGIPDEWVQQSFVPIQQDNTYNYNVSFSKQNKENLFTELAVNWDSICNTNYPFRAIYSDPQSTNADSKINNWLTYKAISFFDFPQNFGKLISIDGIQNKAILVRFENKSLMYGSLLTINTNTAQAAYVGNSSLFKGSPPIDFAETDLGYVGSQNKMILKIPQGQIITDAKRGQIFLISGTQAQDITGFGSGVNRFITDHLAFKILNHFPKVNIDNHFKGIGIHGVYDSKYERVLITKLDYEPLSKDIKYDELLQEFYIEIIVGGIITKETIYLEDKEYFCNRSFTLSFNFNTKSWIAFHSYLPNFYIGENNFFYSGINNACNNCMDFFVGILDDTLITTTTTTLRVIDCQLEGTVRMVECELEASAVIVTTTTTLAPTCRKWAGDQTNNGSGYVNSFIVTFINCNNVTESILYDQPEEKYIHWEVCALLGTTPTIDDVPVSEIYNIGNC